MDLGRSLPVQKVVELPPPPPPPHSTPGIGNSKAIKQFVKGFKQKGVEFVLQKLK